MKRYLAAASPSRDESGRLAASVAFAAVQAPLTGSWLHFPHTSLEERAFSTGSRRARLRCALRHRTRFCRSEVPSRSGAARSGPQAGPTRCSFQSTALA